MVGGTLTTAQQCQHSWEILHKWRRFWRVLNWKIIEVNGGLLQQAMCTGRYFAKTVKPWNQWDLRAYEARNIWSNTRERGPIPLVLLERVFTVPASWMRQGCASLVPCKKKWSHNYGTGGRTIKTCHIERTSQISRLRCPRLRANELRILWNFSMFFFFFFFLCWTHRIHGAAIYGVPWIPSIYPLYVSINLPAPWIRHGWWTLISVRGIQMGSSS